MEDARYSLTHLTDRDVEAGLHRLVASHNHGLADLLCHLGEVEARKLYLQHACSSVFTYCTSRLGFSEDETYKRTQAARAARSYPSIFAMVAAGRLHLSAVNLLAPHLTPDNHADLLAAAAGKSKRAVEELVAARFPRPDAPTLLRKVPDLQPTLGSRSVAAPTPVLDAAARDTSLPQNAVVRSPPASPAATAAVSTTASTAAANAPDAAPFALAPSSPPHAAPAAKARLEPLSAERFKLQVTLSRNARDTLLRLQALMRHSVPSGDLSSIIERALVTLCEQVEARRLGKKRGRRRSPPEASSQPPPQSELGDARPQAAGVPASGPAASVPAPAQVPPATLDGAPDAPKEPNARPMQKRSRHIGNAVRREVVAREGYQCSFVDAAGNRCEERGFLQLHHEKPFACGGPSTASNVTWRCAAHHAAQTLVDFGAEHVRARIDERRLHGASRGPVPAPAQVDGT